MVYLKIHHVHIKPKKPKQMRELNLHKGHQFQGNNITDSSWMLCSFTANSSPRTGTAFLFPAFLDYFLPLSCREELGGQLAASKGHPTTKAPLCDRRRPRCSLQTQARLEFRFQLLLLQGPHIFWSSSFWHSNLIWANFQGGICIRSCIIYNLLKTGNAWTWAINSTSWAENFQKSLQTA